MATIKNICYAACLLLKSLSIQIFAAISIHLAKASEFFKRVMYYFTIAWEVHSRPNCEHIISNLLCKKVEKNEKSISIQLYH